VAGGRFWTALLVLLLTVTVARSTSTVQWVDGIDVIIYIAVLGAVLLGALALSRIREPIGLGIGLVLAPVAAVIGAWPLINARRERKPHGRGAWVFLGEGSGADGGLVVVRHLAAAATTADRTLDLESGVFSGWAQLQQRLSHPGIFSTGRGTGVTGFTDEVKL